MALTPLDTIANLAVDGHRLEHRRAIHTRYSIELEIPTPSVTGDMEAHIDGLVTDLVTALTSRYNDEHLIVSVKRHIQAELSVETASPF